MSKANACILRTDDKGQTKGTLVESWVTIIRCYDMHGKVYFRVKTCSRQHKEGSRGVTLRDALQACVEQSNKKITCER